MRLTKYQGKDRTFEYVNADRTGWDIPILKKLGQLEDIEDELGIDLITLFKAIKEGIWIRKSYYCGTCDLEGKPIFIQPFFLHLGMYDYYTESLRENANSKCEKALCFYDMEYEDINDIAKVKDYGKTWALTKEELV